MTNHNTTGIAMSIDAVASGVSAAEKRTASRPATHRPNRPASGQPTIGSRPVQFGTAVSRNPAITALR